jgi:hypothetical protein
MTHEMPYASVKKARSGWRRIRVATAATPGIDLRADIGASETWTFTGDLSLPKRVAAIIKGAADVRLQLHPPA